MVKVTLIILAEFLQRFYSTHYRGLYRGGVHSGRTVSAGAGDARAADFAAGAVIASAEAAVLDVGCGWVSARACWRLTLTFGCDYGRDYARCGREMGLISGWGLEAVAGAGPFDVIVASHVLEHSTDPIEPRSR